MDSVGQRPMVVRPSELPQPGRLDKRLRGRLVEVEHVPNARFGCYTSCAARRLATSSPSRRGTSLPLPLPLFLIKGFVRGQPHADHAEQAAGLESQVHARPVRPLCFDKGAGVAAGAAGRHALHALAPSRLLERWPRQCSRRSHARVLPCGRRQRSPLQAHSAQPGFKAGEFSEAEVLVRGELATAAEQVPRLAMMELRRPSTATCALPAVKAEELRANIAGRERCKALSQRWRRCRARLRPRTGDVGLAGDARCFFADGRSEEVLSGGRVGGAVLHAGSPADLAPGAGRLLALHGLRHLLSQDLRQTQRSWPAGVRPCYSLEAMLDARIFSTCVDEVLRAALALRPGDAVEPRENAEHEIRTRCALRRGARRSVLWTDWLSRSAQHLASGACSRDAAYLLGLG